MQGRGGLLQGVVATWTSGWLGKLGLGCGALALVMVCSIACVGVILVIPTPEEASEGPTTPTVEQPATRPPTSTPEPGATSPPPTPTPVPATATPTSAPPSPTPVPPTATATSGPPTAAPTPEPFVIEDEAFEADIKETCKTDIAITGVDGDSLQIKVLSGSLSIRQGRLAVWCYGAKHTWMGTLTYGGHTFASDEDNPLQFTVDRYRGYAYLGGEGSVERPDGTVVELPR